MKKARPHQGDGPSSQLDQLDGQPTRSNSGAGVHDPVDRVLALLDQPRRSGDGWSARCPAHDDRNPSLTVSVGDDDRVLLTCHAGCDTPSVVDALGLAMGDLYADRSRSSGRRIDLTYPYVDEHGNVVYEVVRFDPKDFRQRRPDGRGGWEWKVAGTRRVLYRLPKVLAAVAAGDTVYVAEGEKDVATLERAGVVATCNSGGAGKWDHGYSQHLAGATVVVVADADDTGRKHARTVADSLTRAGCTVTVVEPAVGKDATEHVSAGRTIDELVPIEDTGTTEAEAEPGHQILDDVADLLARYVAFTEAAHLTAVALWVAHAHAVDASESTPRLALLSAEKQSGKTRTLEVVELLVPRPMFTSSTSAAAMFRAIASVRPTLMIDEVDTIFGPAAGDHEELRGVLNSGHRRGAVVYRCDGPQLTVKPFPVYTPVVLAGIGELPDTVSDRSVVIPMKRRAPGDAVQSFRRRKVKPGADQLRDRIAAWVEAVTEQITDAEPDMGGLTDRPADVWEPLLALADAAGGDWPVMARAAAQQITGASTGGTDTSIGVRLLSDIRGVFTAPGTLRKLPSSELAERLAGIEEAPWGDLRGHPLDARGLARRLHPYDIGPRKYREGDKTHRGYERRDFVDAWARYLPRRPPGTGTSATTGTPQVTATRDVPDVPDVPVPEGTEAEADDEAPDYSDPDQLFDLVDRHFPGSELLAHDDPRRHPVTYQNGNAA